ncbi:unnamed protein product [Allacma fusca]|uniref:MADF domain-containing protein n=1 Tax=Allacma fusca TaxID=39272 RepID=A0A8J2J7S9_9HEXA|nr:unnamed protein product [Allacma fusca]
MGEPAKTKAITITDEVDTLINMVQLRRYLYNKQHKKYFDRELKQIAWQETGKVSSMTGPLETIPLRKLTERSALRKLQDPLIAETYLM